MCHLGILQRLTLITYSTKALMDKYSREIFMAKIR